MSNNVVLWNPDEGKTIVVDGIDYVRVDDLEKSVLETHEILTKLLAQFQSLSAEVGPTIEGLMQHPMLKMMGLGKKKGE